jgi:hypothetical protein
MAVTAGATITYDEGPTGGNTNREDLGKVLWDVSPTDTPFLSAIGKNKATATSHDWPTQELKAPAHLISLEGEDAVPVKPDPRSRLSNKTQIIKDHAVASGTQEVVLKSGSIGSEVAKQIANRMREFKTHVEFSMIGRSGGWVAGDAGTEREMGSLDCYLIGDSYQGSGTAPSDGTGANAPTPGAGRDLDEALHFKPALGALWGQSGGNRNLLAVCNQKQRGIISTFAGSATRYVTTNDARLQASIDVYDGDFHVVTVTPSRQCLATNVFIVDTEYLKCSDLRSIQVKDLAVIGDSKRKEVLWETTLEVCTPKAHANIADLN